MTSKSLLLPAYPLAALLLTQCVTDEASDRAAPSRPETPIAAYAQSQLPFNPSQFTSFEGDFNGDAKKDLFFIGNAGDVHVRFSNGSNYASYKSLLNAGAFGSLQAGNYLLGDLDGNGKSDLFFIGSLGDVHVRFSNGSDYWSYKKLVNAGYFEDWSHGQYLMGDIDGDNRTDLFFIGNSGNLRMMKGNGSTLNAPVSLIDTGKYGSLATGKYLFGDLNADNKSDLFFIGNNGEVKVRLSSGSGFLSATQIFTPGQYEDNWSNGQFLIGDITGEGKDDMFFMSKDGWGAISYSLGNTFQGSMYVPMDNYGTIALGQYYLGDFNGDGKKDLYYIGNEGGVNVKLSNGSRFDTVLNLLNGGAFGTPTTGMYQ